MADFHSKSFFGLNNGIIVSSPTKKVPYIFIRCIKRKEDQTWEKPAKGEGKTVKISIEEIICILEVLRRNSANWRGYHVFKEDQTEIYMGWDDDSRQILLIKIGEYEKKLHFPSTSFLLLLLEHILQEKIEFATSGTFEPKIKGKEEQVDENDYSIFSEHITTRDGLQVVETTKYGAFIETMEVNARIIAEGPKSLLIALDSNQEFWIPKSTMRSAYDLKEREKFQKLIVDKWIIEKNQKFLIKNKIK